MLISIAAYDAAIMLPLRYAYAFVISMLPRHAATRRGRAPQCSPARGAMSYMRCIITRMSPDITRNVAKEPWRYACRRYYAALLRHAGRQRAKMRHSDAMLLTRRIYHAEDSRHTPLLPAPRLHADITLLR